MKKILLIILCCLCLCGCGKKTDEKEPETDKNIESKTEEETESRIISESELGIKYSYDQVYYHCFLLTYSNGKIISSHSFSFYFDKSGNTSKYFFLATYSDGTTERFWKEPDETCNTYSKIKSTYTNSSWKCNLFLNNY